MGRAIISWLGWILVLLGSAGAAQASPIELRHRMQPVPAPVEAAGHLAPGDWTWLRLDRPERLATLPAGWQLFVDQTRFRRIMILATAADGTRQRIDLPGSGLGRFWAPGGLLQFRIDRPGREIRSLAIGFEGLDTLSLMRKVTAATPADANRQRDRWFILFGLFCGALASAFAYNLVIYTGQRYPFQRWYLLWVAAALAYGFAWTNMIGLVAPQWVGPVAVRADFVLVGLLIAAGDMFFLTVLEQGMLPRWLRGAIRLSAVASAIAGILAAMDGLFPAATTDRILSDILSFGTLAVLIGMCVAIGRGSRVIWFYLAGWAPVLGVFALRLARNFGLAAQDDIVDLATFGTLGFEAIILSLAIADRFRLLRQERDAAEQARIVGEAEAAAHRRAALTDFLTGLGNRGAFQAAMQEQLLSGDARGFTLFLIDVDHLKEVNDRMGHAGGDALLAFVARSLTGIAGTGATLHRIGGDEFALIQPGTQDREAARLGRDLDALQGCGWGQEAHGGAVSLSIGSAHFPLDAADGDTLFSNADLALYEAKRNGRRRTHRYDPALRRQVEGKAALVREAHRSLIDERFSLHFQPLVQIDDGTCIGHEALLRWDHPDHGPLTPEAFADVLVEDGIGMLLQNHVLDLALDHLVRDGGAEGFLCVNVTAAQLQGVEGADHILDRLRARGIAPRRLCVEVTEGVVLQRANAEIAAALHRLHAAGIRIALDDFGTGYASLVHLQQIPADTLKIDRSFVARLGQDAGEAEEIIRAIIGLGHGLKKMVIAEGIETVEQRLALARLGCRYAQGYLFGRPAPARVGDMPVSRAA